MPFQGVKNRRRGVRMLRKSPDKDCPKNCARGNKRGLNIKICAI